MSQDQKLVRKQNALLPSDHQKPHRPEPDDEESPSSLKTSKGVNHEDEQKGKTKKAAEEAASSTEDSGRERLKRHRVEVAGQVWIPDIWGQEELLKDWIDCSAFDASLMNANIMSARAALVEERSRVNSGRLRIENSC